MNIEETIKKLELQYKINFKKITGGLRCYSYIMDDGVDKKIIQFYFGLAKYQAEKKYNITEKILTNHKISVIPEAFSYGKNKNYSWLITELKNGVMLSEIRNRSKEFSLNKINSDLANCLHSIHTVEVANKYGWITDKEVIEYEKFTDYLKSEISRFRSSIEGNIGQSSLDEMIEKANKALDIIKKYENRFVPTLCWYDINPNNILVDKEKECLTGFIDAGGAKYGIKEWDIAFIKMETCINEKEYKSFLKNYKKLDNSIIEEVIDQLCVFIELDDMLVRILDKIKLPKPYDTNFKDIINEIEKNI